MSRSLRAALGKLRRAEGGQLAGSFLSEAQRRDLQRFAQQTGSIQIRPSGRGVVYVMVQPAIVERHWRELTPLEASDRPDDLPDRARNIAAARASKSARHGHAVHYLLLKAGPGPVYWQDGAGHALDLRQATDLQGAAVLAIGEGNRWSCGGTLWLVENQALFDRLDWLPPSADPSVAYYSGQLRNRLIAWLAEQPRAEAVWFFPDYDGVGLLNYARLKTRLGKAVRFWLMPDWEAHLSRFGNPALWQSTAREFQAARRRLAFLEPEPEVLALIGAMQRLGLALEQEAVWLAR